MTDKRTKQANQGQTPDLKTPTLGKIWHTAVEMRHFTAPQLAEKAGVAVSTVSHTLRKWEIEGFFKLDGTGVRNAQAYSFIKEQHRAFGPGEMRLWQTARYLGTFSIGELAGASSVEGGAVSEEDAKRFVNALVAAAYARLRTKAVKGRSAARYQLIKDTGPRPPVARKVTVLVDANIGEVILPEEYRA